MRSAIRHRHSWLTAKDVRTARVPTSLRTFFRHRKLGCITRGITVGSAPNEKTVPQSCVLSCSQAVHGRYGKGRHGLRRFARNDEREFLHATNWHDGQINKSLSAFPAPSEQKEGKATCKARAYLAARMRAHALAGSRRAKYGEIFPWENQQRRCRRQGNSWNCRALYGQSTIGWDRGGGLASSSGVTNRSRRGTSSRALGRTEAQGSVRLFQPFGV